MTKLLTLDDWARQRYGDAAPCMNTLRAWCRTGKIQPTPEKHGRAYFLSPDAAYTPYTASQRLVRRLYGSTKKRA